MLSIPQRYRRTDGRTTYDSNTALALRASRGKNCSVLICLTLEEEEQQQEDQAPL